MTVDVWRVENDFIFTRQTSRNVRVSSYVGVILESIPSNILAGCKVLNISEQIFLWPDRLEAPKYATVQARFVMFSCTLYRDCRTATAEIILSRNISVTMGNVIIIAVKITLPIIYSFRVKIFLPLLSWGNLICDHGELPNFSANQYSIPLMLKCGTRLEIGVRDFWLTLVFQW